jgi:hypothetical protein
MTVRVTRAHLEVLTTSGTPLNGYVDSTYAFDFETHAGFTDSTYELQVQDPHNGFVDSQYSIPKIEAVNGFLESQYQIIGLAVQTGARDSRYTLDAQEARNGFVNTAYLLNLAANSADGWLDAAHVLDAYQEANGFVDTAYSLAAAFEGMTAAFVAVYTLENAPIAASGWLDSSFILDAFEARDGFTDATYELLAKLNYGTYLGSEYAIEVLQALESKRDSQYQLSAAFVAAQGYTDALYELQVLGQLNGHLDASYSLNAYLQAESFRQSSYLLNKALAAVDGFADADYVLNAYLPANGFVDGQYDIEILVALSGYADATYELFRLLQLDGYTDSQYFLDVTDAIYTWVVNANSGAPYRYEDHDFHSFGKLGNKYLGAKADGIYLLEGADDGGTEIDAIASTGRLDFGSSSYKRVLAAYLGVNSAGQVNLTLRTDADRSYGPYQFRVAPTGHQVERAKFAKGVKSRYWEFDIQNVAGGALDIDEIEFDVLDLAHRLKR